MPPRWVCYLIVLFWLGTTGPLVWKELITPFWRADHPPPATFDLMDEAQGPKRPILWMVHVGQGEPDLGISGHRAESWIGYNDAEDTFTIHTELTASQRLGPISFGPVKLRKLVKVERVDREARLLELRVEVEADASLFALVVERASLIIEGKVENNTFSPVVAASFLGESFPVPPMQLPGDKSVLQPLNLVNHLRGLRPGQTWTVPMMDSVKTTLNIFGGSNKADLRYVEARVLPEPQRLPGPTGVLCHVIEYDDPETRPRTWVQISTEEVVRQEAVYEETRIIIQRFNIQPDR
jgi:hypothetical protein